MKTEYMIAVDDFCAKHNIEISFISALKQSVLIEIISKKEIIYLESTQLQ